MPPKTARLQEEVEAQRARAAALQYLAKTGAGPSQKEIAQQQQDREKWTNSASQAIQQRLVATSQATATVGYGAPMRDNTLEALAAVRARQRMEEGGSSEGGYGTQAAETAWGSIQAHSSDAHGTEDSLPSGWKTAVDPTTGDTYYWNETTKQTSWDRPKTPKERAEPKQDQNASDEEEEEVMEENWEEVTEPQSKAVYYWNRETNETTWTKPVKKTVSLEKAREAKSKLDAILNSIGNGVPPPSSKKRPVSPTDAEKEKAPSKTQKLN